jgi:hypothetical protein
MSHPETAKRGMHLAEFGMLMAIIGTLVHHEIVTYTWILAGLAIGSVVGLAMGCLGADDGDAATNRAITRVWRLRRSTGGHLGVLSRGRPPPDTFMMGAARVRSDAGGANDKPAVCSRSQNFRAWCAARR